MNTDARRHVWVAGVLSLCCTGLGHLYAGRLKRGLILFLSSLVVVPVAALIAGFASSTAGLIGLVASFAGLIGLWLFAVVDACRTAARGMGAELSDYQKPVVYALFIVAGITSPALSTLYVRQNLLEAFYLPTESMMPTLHRGDRILANKTTWRVQNLKRYDCIVFRPPDHRSQNYIKRIIGLPGETVTIDDDGVKVNGQLLTPPGNAPPGAAPGALPEGDRPADRARGDNPSNEGRLEHSVAPGTCFVLGDNRENSRDSRHFGPVPLGDVIGVAEYVYIPGDSWSRFGTLP